MDPHDLRALLLERTRRQQAKAEAEAKKRAEEEAKAGQSEEAKAKTLEVVQALRAHYHEHQASFFSRLRNLARSLWRGAALCTRRAGKTAGGTRETLARCLEMNGYRIVYCGATRNEAKARAWESDTLDGWIDLLTTHGVQDFKSRTLAFDIGGVRAEVNQTDLTIDFSNGSQLLIFAADHLADQRKLRGRAKHVVWVDEAQEFLELQRFVENVLGPMVKDFKGEIWLTGTPSEDCSGYFYEVTCEPDSGDTPRVGWSVHRWDVTDNPFFGRVIDRGSTFDVVDQFGELISVHVELALAEVAAAELRWEANAGAALRENGWTGDEPQFLREYKRRWVKTDAWYIYPVHAVAEHVLHWRNDRGEVAPMRLDEGGWLDYQAAWDDLPRIKGQWLFGAGADFGYWPHAFAIVVWAFTMEMPEAYEFFSWKQTKVLPDDQRDYLHRVVKQVPNLMVLVGDPGGQKNQDLIAWQERTGLPIEAADKAQKSTWQNMLGGDIRTGRVKFRKGSPMLHEMRHSQFKRTAGGKLIEQADRKLPDGTVPGDDCSYAGLYSYRHSLHLMHRTPEHKPKPGTEEALKAEAEQYMRQQEQAGRVAKGDDLQPVWGGNEPWSF